MAESTLSLTYTDIADRLMRHSGQGRVYGTGTVTIASGVVTLTSGTFPAWAASAVLEHGSNSYTVNTRDSGTQVTLDDTSVTDATSTAYALWEGTEEEFLAAKGIIKDGLSLFYKSHKWRFLRPITTLTLNTTYSTGTVTVASGVVTGSGTTFPSWAANGDLTVGGVTYEVSTRDSDTQVTLVDTSVTVSDASSYSLEQTVYDLPDDFSGMDSPITYRPGDANFYPTIRLVDEAQIRAMRQRLHYVQFRPQFAALRAPSHDATTGSRWQIVFDVGSNDNYILTYRYRSRPNDLNPTNKYPVGGPEHDRTILAAVLMTAEEQRDDRDGVWEKRFAQELIMSKTLHDEEVAPLTLGYAHDQRDVPLSGNVAGFWQVGYAGHTIFTGPWSGR